MFFVAHCSILFSFKAKNNFHNARGHYGEILPRRQPITVRDFTGSNLCHIVTTFNVFL